MTQDQRTEAVALAALEHKVYADWDQDERKYIACSVENIGDLCAAVTANGNRPFYGDTPTLALAAAAMGMKLEPKGTAADTQAAITEERLKEIEQQARGIFPPPPKGYQAGNGLAVMAAIEGGKMEALATVPELVAEIHRLRTKVQEQENTIATLKAGNVRSITYPTIPAHLRGGAFKTQDESATTRGPSGFTITTNAALPTDTVLMVNHPTQARPELICARCGGWHPYMQQVVTIKDGVVGQAEWVGCTGPKATTDGNQGEGR